MDPEGHLSGQCPGPCFLVCIVSACQSVFWDGMWIVPVGAADMVNIDEKELQKDEPHDDARAGIHQHECVVSDEVVVGLVQLCQQHKNEHSQAHKLCAVDECDGPLQVHLAQVLNAHHNRSCRVIVPAGRPCAWQIASQEVSLQACPPSYTPAATSKVTETTQDLYNTLRELAALPSILHQQRQTQQLLPTSSMTMLSHFPCPFADLTSAAVVSAQTRELYNIPPAAINDKKDMQSRPMSVKTPA